MEIILSRGGEGNAADINISDVRGGIRTDNRDAAPETGASVTKERETGYSDYNMRDYPHRINRSGYTECISAYDDIRLMKMRGCDSPFRIIVGGELPSRSIIGTTLFCVLNCIKCGTIITVQ